jgi:ElaB/YqjD/DUF883 family membrane-anchored ribosome-binding protein
LDTQSATGVGRQEASTAEIIEGLNDLLQLDHDAVGAYDIAIEKLQDRDHADQIVGFRRDHERHIRELNELIAGLGGTPVNEPHATAPLKEGLQSLGGVVGDKGVLIAWRANEVLARTKYDSYARKSNHWPAHVKRVVDQNALDEERHVDWVTRVLDSMGVPTAEGLETTVATKLRETSARVENAVESAKHTVSDAAAATRNRVRDAVGDAAATTRNRIAGTMDSAADSLEQVAEQRAGSNERLERAGHRVASGMHTGASYVRNADLERVRLDLERSVRQHPVRTLGILFATGFVIGRLLR